MISISLCMIVKDEEKYLENCLQSISHIVDEIIIVDTGSTDKTKEIAGKYTDKIYDFTWQDDFSLARNFSFSKATKDYIMWLDADDILLKEDQEKLLNLKQKMNPQIDVVYMQYSIGECSEDYTTCVFWRERLVKREHNFKWIDPVHEYIECTGHIARIDITITHTKHESSVARNLDIFEKYIAKNNVLTSRQCFHYARALYASEAFDKAIEYYNLFLEGAGGIRSNYLYACIELANCYGKKQDNKNMLRSILRFFEYDMPRAEICCKLGSYYKQIGDYEKAIEWYKIAPTTKVPKDSIGAIMLEYWDYVPYMELCACYYKLGDLEHAIYYNEKVAQIKPNDEKMLKNRVFLANQRMNLK